jgi:hypothetical protein
VKAFAMMKKLIGHSIPTILSGLICSCGCDYDSEQLTMWEGSLLATHHNGTYRLDLVTANSITLSHSGGRHRQGWRLDSAGSWGSGEPHSLGNNESLNVLSVEPHAKTAIVELMWRDWCGPFSFPSF